MEIKTFYKIFKLASFFTYHIYLSIKIWMPLLYFCILPCHRGTHMVGT